jgi:hypothetical protein
MNLRDRLKSALRRPEPSPEEAEFNRRLGVKRLLILLPFIIAAAVVLLLSFK